jgi:hypothetical protein
MTPEIAEIIAAQLVARYATCTPADVESVARHGSVDESIVGPDYDDALTDAILEQLDERGIAVGS